MPNTGHPGKILPGATLFSPSCGEAERGSAGQSQFVGKLTAELEPALVQYRLVQSGLGTDIPTWAFQTAGCRPGHISHFQVFHDNHSVVFA
jgi:hypothetical protein